MYWFTIILILPYIFLLLKIYRSLVKIQPFNITRDPLTFVSVVVACKNEQGNLPPLLNCLDSQDYPRELYEVIIVNDNSTDRTFEVASDFSMSCKKILLTNEGKGKKQAIRTGIKTASGNLIVTTDADCLMGKRWLRTIAAFFEKEGSDMIICPVQLDEGSGFFRRFQELEFLGLQGITAGSAFSGESTMCNGANLSFKRQVYLDNAENLYDRIASGDDIFLLHSLKNNSKSSISWLESTESIVTAKSSSSPGGFFKQRRRWLSKGKYYRDLFTYLLGIVTFITIFFQVVTFITGFLNPLFWWIFLAVFLLKSIPDFLILRNTSMRYGRQKLMNWFFPAQLVYPFYVMAVVVYSLIGLRNEEI